MVVNKQVRVPRSAVIPPRLSVLNAGESAANQSGLTFIETHRLIVMLGMMAKVSHVRVSIRIWMAKAGLAIPVWRALASSSLRRRVAMNPRMNPMTMHPS